MACILLHLHAAKSALVLRTAGLGGRGNKKELAASPSSSLPHHRLSNSSGLGYQKQLTRSLAIRRRVRLASGVSEIIHPDGTIEFNIVGLDLLGLWIDFEDVHTADGERREVEAPTPEHLVAQVEDVQCVDGWDAGHILQAADEFRFGVGGAELCGQVSGMGPLASHTRGSDLQEWGGGWRGSDIP
jgi:hypothetical protein